MKGLTSKRIAGVALDVFEHEPCTDSPLFQLPGALCTPHLGASTEEAQTNVAIEAAQLLTNFLLHGEIRHAVNAAAVDPKTLASMRGHLNLIYRLGLLLYQWQEGQPQRCRVVYRGDVATKDTRLLTSAFCAGLLARAMPGDVNIVNSEVLMRERGIEVTTTVDPAPGAFSSSIRVEIDGEANTSSATGTLFGNDMPRLVTLNDFRMEAYLDGILFLFKHRDVPGIIGAVGTIFGSHHVNIGQMSVGRADLGPGGEAVGVLNLDSKPPLAAIEEVLQHKDILSADVAELPGRDEAPACLG